MAPCFSKLWKDILPETFKEMVFSALGAQKSQVAFELWENVAKHVKEGHFDGRLVLAMTDSDWWSIATPNTMLEHVTPTPPEIAFVRKLVYTFNRHSSDVLKKGTFIALVVKKSVIKKALRMDKLFDGIELALEEMYPGVELQKDVKDFGYAVVLDSIYAHVYPDKNK